MLRPPRSRALLRPPAQSTPEAGAQPMPGRRRHGRVAMVARRWPRRGPAWPGTAAPPPRCPPPRAPWAMRSARARERPPAWSPCSNWQSTRRRAAWRVPILSRAQAPPSGPPPGRIQLAHPTPSRQRRQGRRSPGPRAHSPVRRQQARRTRPRLDRWPRGRPELPPLPLPPRSFPPPCRGSQPPRPPFLQPPRPRPLPQLTPLDRLPPTPRLPPMPLFPPGSCPRESTRQPTARCRPSGQTLSWRAPSLRRPTPAQLPSQACSRHHERPQPSHRRPPGRGHRGRPIPRCRALRQDPCPALPVPWPGPQRYPRPSPPLLRSRSQPRPARLPFRSRTPPAPPQW